MDYLQATYSSMALKVGGPCTFGPPLPESGGRDPRRIAATGRNFQYCIVSHSCVQSQARNQVQY